jgi:hypothetical protein
VWIKAGRDWINFQHIVRAEELERERMSTYGQTVLVGGLRLHLIDGRTVDLDHPLATEVKAALYILWGQTRQVLNTTAESRYETQEGRVAA